MMRFVRCKEVTSFWGMEVNHILKSRRFPLWTNPTAGTRLRGKVRLHGTAFHTFHLHGYRWLEPGTTHRHRQPRPISRQGFVVEAGEGVSPVNSATDL
jgi:hypothetical protein